MNETDKQIKRLERKHEKICNKLEQLNQEAFEIEKELMYLRGN